MSIIRARGQAMRCCAAPPKPDPAEPACPELADDAHGLLVVRGVAFAFCSPACRARFESHPGWGSAIAADILAKM
jgi:hypothetical protein